MRQPKFWERGERRDSNLGTLDAVRKFSNIFWLSVPDNRMEGTLEPVASLTKLTTLTLSQNNFNGSLAFVSELSALRGFYASSNRFSSSIETLDSLASIVFIDIRNNSFEGHFPPLRSHTVPLALKIENNRWLCPFPKLDKDVVVSRDACLQDWQTIALYGGLALAGLAVLADIDYMWGRCGKRCGDPESSTLMKKSLEWLLTQALLASDVYFFVTMCLYLASLSNHCQLANLGDIFLAFMPYDFEREDVPLDNFASYFAWIVANYPHSTVETETIEAFTSLCEGFNQCAFVAATNECQSDGMGVPQPFTALFLTFLATRACRELGKLLLVIVFWWKKVENMGLFAAQYISSSILLPLLAYCEKNVARNALFHDKDTVRERVCWFVTEGLLQSLPQLALGLYSALVVVQTGFGPLSVISVCGAFVSLGIKVFHFFRVVCKTRRERKKARPEPQEELLAED